jgi:ketosteroid isomerase-like protein
MDAMVQACGSERIEEMSKQQASRLIDSMMKYIHGMNLDQSGRILYISLSMCMGAEGPQPEVS